VGKEPSIGERLAQMLDIPLDTTLEWPKLELTANRHLVVENHRGVIEYDPNTVRINTKFGEVKISGSNLSLVSALKDEIVIDGKINQVELVDWR